MISSLVLRHRLGGLGGVGWPAYLGRLAAAVLVSTGLALGLRLVLPDLGADPSVIAAFFHVVLLGGAAVLAYLFAARLLRLNEVTSVLGTVLRRTSR